MTPTQLDNLDRLCAEKVIGWTYLPTEGDGIRERPAEYLQTQKLAKYWKPTRDIAQAFELFPHVELMWAVLMSANGYKCSLIDIFKKEPDILVEAETAPLAITIACLKAKGVEIDTNA